MTGGMHSLLPCTTLAGCAVVCIRKTAHRSYSAFLSAPCDGSLHNTSISLHNSARRGRGVSSGCRQSTCTSVLSPSGLKTSANVAFFRTTRDRFKVPSIISRLRMKEKKNRGSASNFDDGTGLEDSPVWLYQRTREFATNLRLPVQQLPARFRFTFALVHVGGERRNVS